MKSLWLFRGIYSCNRRNQEETSTTTTATGSDANARVAFKYCASFTKCITHINNEHVDGDIIIPMYNLIDYSDIYSDTLGSLWQFNRDESPVTNAGNPSNVSTAN